MPLEITSEDQVSSKNFIRENNVSFVQDECFRTWDFNLQFLGSSKVSKAPNASPAVDVNRRKELRRSYKFLMNETATFEDQEVEEVRIDNLQFWVLAYDHK